MRVYVLSNGFGEDYGGAVTAAALAERRPGLEIAGAPLVTPGEAYRQRAIPVVTRGRLPASGGFPASGLMTALRDVPAVPQYGAYVRTLRRMRTPGDVAIAVGDTFLCALARLAFGRRTVHVAVAKSVLARPHSAFERLLLRRWGVLVLARDEATAEHLARAGVRASCAGNPLVDGFTPPSSGSHDPPRVLLLPGSRAEAAGNLELLLGVVDGVTAPAVWQCAWAPSQDQAEARRVARGAGWSADAAGFLKGSGRVDVDPGAFATWLPKADLVVGLAGTAHEQAAGLGKPVVTFVGSGPQSTASRMAEQERLLGGAARFVPDGPAAVASEVQRLLGDPAERERRGRLGRDRMGPAGAGGHIAVRVIEEFSL